MMSAHFSRANLVYNCTSVLPSSLVILTQMREMVKLHTSLYDLVCCDLGHFFTDNHLIHFLPGNMSLLLFLCLLQYVNPGKLARGGTDVIMHASVD